MRTLSYLRPGDRVLEVGCSSGALSARIQAMGCAIVGIERRPEAAAQARRFCEDVLVGDFATMGLPLSSASFDVILLVDVLEHLEDPGTALQRVYPFLKPNGRLVIAVPNIAHWSVRFRLLRGRFDYEDSGILDRTHLRFFTLHSVRRMLEEAGMEILDSDIVPDVPILRFKPGLQRINYEVARMLPGLMATEGFFVGRPRKTSPSR